MELSKETKGVLLSYSPEFGDYLYFMRLSRIFEVRCVWEGILYGSAVCPDRFFQEDVYEESCRSSRPAATPRTAAEFHKENIDARTILIL